MDADSIALVNKLVGLPGIAVVISSRPVVTEDEGYRNLLRGSTKLALKPFNMRETESLLMQEFDLENVGKHVLSFCHKRAQGLPATVGPLFQSLLDGKILERLNTVHSTMKQPNYYNLIDSIMTRFILVISSRMIFG